jgi:hypothetical protein
MNEKQNTSIFSTMIYEVLINAKIDIEMRQLRFVKKR